LFDQLSQKTRLNINTEQLKVLVIAQYFLPDMGGASTRASNVVKGLNKCGCKVTVVAAFPHYPHGQIPENYRHKLLRVEQVGNTKIYRTWVPSLPHSSPLKRIILHLSFILSSLFALPFTFKCDVVWSANPNLFSTIPGFIYGKAKRAQFIRNVDDLWPEVFYDLGLVKSSLIRRFLDFSALLSYSIPTAITPISESYKTFINKKYCINPKKIHVIEVGVEPPLSLIRSQKGETSPFVVMYSGVLGYGYDFGIILDAAQKLREKNILFVIRGVGELSLKLDQSIRSLNLTNVLLDTRFLSKSELSAMLNSADAFILPLVDARLIDMGLPTKIFEYQAYGKPILCVSKGESASYIQKTGSGVVINPGDVLGLINAITCLRQNRSICEKFSLNGKNYISNNLTTEKIGERMYRIFSELSRKPLAKK
jgi:glycosyltransferase involved in cell wall biosynthesis